jgi:hypothetical protein
VEFVAIGHEFSCAPFLFPRAPSARVPHQEIGLKPDALRKEPLRITAHQLHCAFLELAVIRWLSTEIRIFAYFKNLPLMAAFLGFGIGCYFYRSADVLFYRWFPRFIGGLAAIIALAPVLDLTRVIFVDPRQYFLLGTGFGDHAEVSAPSFFQATKAYLKVPSAPGP